MLGWVLVAAGMVVALASCAPEPVVEEPPAPLAVEVTSIEYTDPTIQSARFPATIIRDREADLSFRIGGQVRSIGVRIGDRLGRGQVVAILDATPFRAARARAEAEVGRLARAAQRYGALVEAGAISRVQEEDNRSALAAARATLDSARYDERSAEVRMPFAGVVLSRDVEVGETVSAGQRLATVADLSSPPLARVQAPQRVAARLRVGETASLLLPGEADPIPARVRRIGAASDARTATTEIELTFQGASGIANGTIGSVSFSGTETVQAGGLLPAEVLLDAREGFGSLFVVDRARSVARRVRVRFVGFEGDRVRVLDLAPDALVITSGAGFVTDGQRVQVSGR